MEATLSFLEMYLAECDQSLQESTDEHNTIKNITWIYQQLLDLQNSDKDDQKYEIESLSNLEVEKQELEVELRQVTELKNDSEKALLLYNTTLPESGVLTKQLNSEIYQTKLGIQQNETDEELLREKIATLKDVLISETTNFERMKSE